MSNWIRNLIPATTLAMLVACGGGGGGGGKVGAVTANKDFPTVAASQTFATSAVTEVNSLVADIQQAQVASNLPAGAIIVGPPTGSTQTGTLQCSTFGTGGSGTADYSYTYTGDKPVSYTFNYHNCSFSSAGYTFTMNGSVVETYSNYTDSDHFTFTYSYDFTYSYSGPSLNESGTLKSAQTCTQDGDNYDCHYAVGGGYSLDTDYSVSTNGNIVTIQSASITTKNATIVISNWVYNTSTARATSGTITITYSSGDQAVVTATGTGYSVAVTISGVTNTYTVSY